MAAMATLSMAGTQLAFSRIQKKCLKENVTPKRWKYCDKIVLKRTDGGNCLLALALLFKNSENLFGKELDKSGKAQPKQHFFICRTEPVEEGMSSYKDLKFSQAVLNVVADISFWVGGRKQCKVSSYSLFNYTTLMFCCNQYLDSWNID